MSEIITCRPGQSCMDAAREAGLAIHPESPTPGRSAEGIAQWARERGITLAGIVRVRRDECFAAVAPSVRGAEARHADRLGFLVGWPHAEARR